MARLRNLLLALPFLAVATADAHEFWIEPRAPQVAPGGLVEADVRIGQKLAGTVYGFFPKWFESFEFVTADERRAVGSIIGDEPAVHEAAGAAGLARLIYRSIPDVVRYKTFGKFESFAATEGLDGAGARHRARGLPEADFAEAYVRFAKTLVAVGDGHGADAADGMAYELVAETNPFTSPAGAPIAVLLLADGAPAPGAQVALFRRDPAGAVTVDLLRTDATGHVAAAAAPGFYLLSAVRLLEPPAEMAERMSVVWLTEWASLAFHRGG